MMQYSESEPYKKNKRLIHFILMGICAVVIIMGAVIYFYQGNKAPL
jgi:flagellar basal body-associated protein FliL